MSYEKKKEKKTQKRSFFKTEMNEMTENFSFLNITCSRQKKTKTNIRKLFIFSGFLHLRKYLLLMLLIENIYEKARS